MADFPSSLVPSVTQGYSFDAPANVLTQTVQGGVPLMMLDYANGPITFNVGLVMTPSDLQTFQEFYVNDIDNGAGEFNINIDSGSGVKSHEVTIDNGSLNIDGSRSPIWTASFSVTANALPLSSLGSVDLKSSLSSYFELTSPLQSFDLISDFTMSFWIKTNSLMINTFILDFRGVFTGNIVSFGGFGNAPAGTIRYVPNGAGQFASTTRVDDGAWHYCSICRNSGVIYIHIDGSNENSQANTTDQGTTSYDRPVVAANTDLGNRTAFMDGFLADLRIDDGVAHYNASNYAVPIESPSAIAETILLIKSDGNTVTDISSSALPVTLYGGAAASLDTPHT